MTPDSNPNTPATTQTDEPAKPGKRINGKFVQDEGVYLTRDQARAMAEHKRASREVEHQWAMITGIRLPE